jgi:[ribosomal protein S18]-alanine N-acetyltransferase
MFLREYREADFEAVYRLDWACFAPRFRFSRPMMRRVVSSPGAVLLVACEGEVLAGFVAVEVQGEWGYVATLDVSPEHRRAGIGRALMVAAEERAQQADVGLMWLHVFVENGAAVRLYEALGYVRVGVEKWFYGRGWDAWVYRKG